MKFLELTILCLLLSQWQYLLLLLVVVIVVKCIKYMVILLHRIEKQQNFLQADVHNGVI